MLGALCALIGGRPQLDHAAHRGSQVGCANIFKLDNLDKVQETLQHAGPLKGATDGMQGIDMAVSRARAGNIRLKQAQHMFDVAGMAQNPCAMPPSGLTGRVATGCCTVREVALRRSLSRATDNGDKDLGADWVPMLADSRAGPSAGGPPAVGKCHAASCTQTLLERITNSHP